VRCFRIGCRPYSWKWVYIHPNHYSAKHSVVKRRGGGKRKKTFSPHKKELLEELHVKTNVIKITFLFLIFPKKSQISPRRFENSLETEILYFYQRFNYFMGKVFAPFFIIVFCISYEQISHRPQFIFF
jgi:hypothetical protein